jgi:O-acetylhomoserine (thiol)-lyase
LAVAATYEARPLLWSTLTSPWLIKPFDTSADLVYHSATKFLSSGTVIGGWWSIRSSFDWDRSTSSPG